MDIFFNFTFGFFFFLVFFFFCCLFFAVYFLVFFFRFSLKEKTKRENRYLK